MVKQFISGKAFVLQTHIFIGPIRKSNCAKLEKHRYVTVLPIHKYNENNSFDFHYQSISNAFLFSISVFINAVISIVSVAEVAKYRYFQRTHP